MAGVVPGNPGVSIQSVVERHGERSVPALAYLAAGDRQALPAVQQQLNQLCASPGAQQRVDHKLSAVARLAALEQQLQSTGATAVRPGTENLRVPDRTLAKPSLLPGYFAGVQAGRKAFPYQNTVTSRALTEGRFFQRLNSPEFPARLDRTAGQLDRLAKLPDYVPWSAIGRGMGETTGNLLQTQLELMSGLSRDLASMRRGTYSVWTARTPEALAGGGIRFLAQGRSAPISVFASGATDITAGLASYAGRGGRGPLTIREVERIVDGVSNMAFEGAGGVTRNPFVAPGFRLARDVLRPATQPLFDFQERAWRFVFNPAGSPERIQEAARQTLNRRLESQGMRPMTRAEYANPRPDLFRTPPPPPPADIERTVRSLQRTAPNPGGFATGYRPPAFEDGQWPILPWYGLHYTIEAPPEIPDGALQRKEETEP